MTTATLERWPHQISGVEEVLAARERGERRICLTSPTGGGKTRMICDLIDFCIDNMLNVVVYTNRKMLVRQTQSVMQAHGIKHGVRAAGHEDERHLSIQISSVQTEAARVIKRQTWKMHDADLVIVDEAHLNAGETAQYLLNAHREAGATCVGVTATPLDIGHLYDTLVVAGTTSQLRECGALVPCRHFGCDEPDLRHIKRIKVGEDLTEAQNRQAIMVPGVFGRVCDWWKKLNKDARPAIGFAPGVKEAVWFCEQFAKIGVRCAEIDGKECWLDGETYQTGQNVRDDILAGSKDGSIKIIWNRFVLREGIDMPWLYHGIFATVFGSLQSFLQSGGRLLRAYPGLTQVILQDHGGNWWRHGSLNVDRQWDLNIAGRIQSGLREERMREKQEVEPIRCPKCGEIRKEGGKCRNCGFEHTRKTRPVIQSDGTLREHEGDIFKPRRIAMKPDTLKIWQSCYYRAKRSRNEMTFRQAEGLFFYENHYYPPRDLPLMPKDNLDWFAKVKDVPNERLLS